MGNKDRLALLTEKSINWRNRLVETRTTLHSDPVTGSHSDTERRDRLNQLIQ